MTTYSDVFGSQTVPPSSFAYKAITLAADTTYFWPMLSDGDNLLAKLMNVTATGEYAITLPDARQVSVGEDLLVNNVGGYTVTIKSSGGSTLATIAAGTVKYLYLTDNSSAAGTWSVFTYGVGSSSADASSLNGYGLTVASGKLATAHNAVSTSTDYSVQNSDRASLIVVPVSSGAVSITLPLASVVGNGFFFMLNNQGSGSVTVANGVEAIDGSLSKSLAPLESCLLVTDGGAWYSVGYGRSTTFDFTQLVKDVTAGGSFTLAPYEYANKLMRFIGTPGSNVTIVVPSVANIYYVQTAYTGAPTLTFKTALGTGVVLTSNDQVVLMCDGTDVVLTQSAVVSSPTSFLDGSAASPSLYFASDTNTGIFRAGSDIFGIAGNGSEVARFGPSEVRLSSPLAVAGAHLSTTRANLGLAIDADIPSYSSGSFTVSVGGTATYRARQGIYIKIGKLLYIDVYMSIEFIGTGSNWLITMTGLPADISTDASLAVSGFYFLANSVVSLCAVATPGNFIVLQPLIAASNRVPYPGDIPVLGNNSTILISGCCRCL